MSPDNQPSRLAAEQATGLKGKTIGDFEILEEIGRGGMGVVFKARQVSLDRFVAFKILSQTLGVTDHAVARFRREAQATAKLHHPNIVPIFAQGHQDDTYYYAMELVDGKSLYDMIKDLRGDEQPGASRDAGGSPVVAMGGSSVASDLALAETELLPGGSGTGTSTTAALPRGTSRFGASRSPGGGGEDPRFAPYDEAYFDTIARQIRDVADALDYAHRQGVIHRDIKPHNLLEGHGGRLCLTDFGLARMLEQPGMTQTGEFVGSPLYMSPEQITGRGGPVGVAADVYSLGATLYEWLTLSPPFPGATREQVISQVITSDSLPPRARNRRVPLDLETICTKALEKEPSQRYQSAADMRDDLTHFLNRAKIKAQRAGVLAIAAKLLSRRRTAATIALAVVTVAVLSVMLIDERRASRVRDAAPQTSMIPVSPTTPSRGAATPGAAAVTGSIERKIGLGERVAEMVGGKSVLSAIFSTGDAERYTPVTHAQRMGAMFVIAIREADASRLAELDSGLIDTDSADFLYLHALASASADGALSDIETCLQRDPAHRAARLLRAWILCQLARPDEMLEEAEALLADDANSAAALTARGAARLLLHQHSMAADDFRAATAGGGGYRIEALTGLALAGTQQADSAIAAFGRALTLNSDCVLSRMRRAELNLAGGHADAAVADLNQVIRLEPGNAEAYELRGACNDRLKHFQEAVADYKTAYEISSRTTLLIKWGAAALNLEEKERVAAESQVESDRGTDTPNDVRKQDRVPAVPPPSAPGSVYHWVQRLLNGVRLPLSFPRSLTPRVCAGSSATAR